ncbi:MAG: ABC transporter permease [Anaerolineae bacterium]|nr:ABC transporter permease [Anaerolineae bacterium]
MQIAQVVLEALESLNSNKMRSALTILGIVIGVAAVIAMLAVGEGAQNTITGSINDIGSNLIFVIGRNNQETVRNPKPFTMADANALKDPFLAPSIVEVAPVLQATLNVTYSKEQRQVTINGITPEFLSMRNYTVSEGELINADHLTGNASVALIGVDTAKNLFDTTEGVVGQTIRIEGQPFRIIGLLTPKGGGAMGSQDNIILVPFNTAQSRLIRRENNKVDVVYMQALDADSVNAAVEEITQILRSRHRITIGPDDFTVMSQKDIVSTVQSITGVFTIFLGGVAGISLLVGGIGIMNIMLVSVTERTREIGLRKALGARKRDILIQFLTESSLLSLLGGIIGIILGWLLAFIIGKIAAAAGTPFNPVVGLSAIAMATVFSTVVGLFFGIYPANRAASLAPVEALRYE